MTNPSKAKGTRFETWVVNTLVNDYGLDAFRKEAAHRYDIEVRGNTGRTIDTLVTRPDYGQPLAIIRFRDFAHILQEHGDNAHIEAKRLAKVAIHSIFEDKFS